MGGPTKYNIIFAVPKIPKNMKYEIPNPKSTPDYYEPTYVGGITWGRKITNEHIWYIHPLNISLPIFVPMGRDAWLEGGILKSCCSPMLKRRLKLKTESPDIAWFPFYPQEHKTHNNVSLVMEHLSLLFLKYPRIWNMKYQTLNLP